MDRIFWFDDSTLCESWLQSRTKIFSEGAGGYKQQVVSRVLWVGGISLILRFQAHFRLRECLLIRPIPSIIDLQDCSTVETGCWLLTLLRSLLCVVSGEEVEQQDSLPAPNWGIEPDTVHQAGAPSQTDDWVGSHHFEGLKIINQRIVGPCSIPSLQSRPIKTWIQDLTSSPFMREVTGGSWRITLYLYSMLNGEEPFSVWVYLGAQSTPRLQSSDHQLQCPLILLDLFLTFWVPSLTIIWTLRDFPKRQCEGEKLRAMEWSCWKV